MFFANHRYSNKTSKGSFDDLNEAFNSVSLSDPIQNNEADPASSLNMYHQNLKPIQPILQFPVHKEGLKTIRSVSFKKEWYKLHDWLEYSVRDNKCYCFPCRMFGKICYSTTLNYTTTTKLKEHSHTANHKDNANKWGSRIFMDSNSKSVATEIDSQHLITVKKIETF